MTMPTRLTQFEQIAFNWMIANPGPHLPSELAAGTTFKSHTARNVLQQLYIKGRVTRSTPAIGAVRYRFEAVVS